MGRWRVDIKGMTELRGKLKRLRDATTEEIKIAVGEGADLIVARQKSLCPVYAGPDPRAHPGALRESIHWFFREEMAKRTGEVAVGSFGEKASGPNATRAWIVAGGDEAPYAPDVEWGTSSMKAEPFFFTGYREERRAVKALIKARALKAIMGVAR